MKKNLLLIALLLTVVSGTFCATTIAADDEKPTSGMCGDSVYWDLSGDVLFISGYGDMYDYSGYGIPWSESVSDITYVDIGDNVTHIGAHSFSTCKNIETVVIGENVETIGSDAFSGTKNMKELYWNAVAVEDFKQSNGIFKVAGASSEEFVVTFGYGVKHIPAYAFYAVIGTPGSSADMTEVILPDTVETIGEYAFYGCDKLQGDLVLPEKVKEIKPGTFGYTGELNFDTGNNVTTIGESAFMNSEIKKMTIGENVTTIGSKAFASMSQLEELQWNAIETEDFKAGNEVFLKTGSSSEDFRVIFGDEVRKIPAYCFYPSSEYGSYTHITSVELSASIESIGDSAFRGCYKLTEVTFVDGLKTIGEYAFYYCSKLSCDIVLPDSVEEIKKYAFAYTGEMTFDTGNGVSRIGEYAFTDSKIKELVVGENVALVENCAFALMSQLEELQWNSDKVADFEKGNKIFHCVGRNAESLRVIFGSIVKKIPANLFYPSSEYDSYPYITSVELSGSIESIGDYAFSSCAKLTEVTFADGLKTIGEYAFNHCSKLSCDIVLPDTVEEIKKYAFAYTGEINFDTGNGVGKIGEYVFASSKIKKLVVGENVTTLEKNAFSSMSQLSELHWNSDKVADLAAENGLFQGSGNRTSGLTVIFGYNVGRVAANLFYAVHDIYNYVPVKSVVMGKNVKSIGANAFRVCKKLSELDLGNVENIEEYAFSGTAIEDLVIPDSVVTIGDYAFSSSGSKCITMGNGLRKIGTKAFGLGSTVERVNISRLDVWCGIEFADEYANPSRAAQMYLDGELVEKLVFDSSITEIKDYAFYNVSTLSEVVLPDSLTRIGKYAFYKCGMDVISFPEYIQEIGENAFRACKSLEKVYFPLTLERIAKNAFSDDSKIKDVYYEGYEADWANVQIESGNTYITKATFHYGQSNPVLKSKIEMDEATGEIKVISQNDIENAVIIVALYTDEGILKEVKYVVSDILQGENKFNDIEYDLNDAYEIKVMVWSSFDSACPQIKAFSELV